jgi:hypothetical protein
LGLVSLALIWSLRQVAGGNHFRVRDAFYNSTYPLVQALFVLLIICIQLLPGAAGAALINLLLVSGVVIGVWPQVIVGLICTVLIAWSCYMLAASLFAGYIVTLPGVTPREALYKAKQLVRHRRALVLRKIVFLPLCLLFVAALIMIPLAVLLTPVAPFIFYLLTLTAVPVSHAYMYTLYRELLGD